MEKIIALVFLVICLGCAPDGEIVIDKKTNQSYHVICLNGVEYYSGHRELSPKYDINGTLSACD